MGLINKNYCISQHRGRAVQKQAKNIECISLSKLGFVVLIADVPSRTTSLLSRTPTHLEIHKPADLFEFHWSQGSESSTCIYIHPHNHSGTVCLFVFKFKNFSASEKGKGNVLSSLRMLSLGRIAHWFWRAVASVLTKETLFHPLNSDTWFTTAAL